MQGNLFVASEDDTLQKQGSYCARRQGQGYRRAARNNDTGQGQNHRRIACEAVTTTQGNGKAAAAPDKAAAAADKAAAAPDKAAAAPDKAAAAPDKAAAAPDNAAAAPDKATAAPDKAAVAPLLAAATALTPLESRQGAVLGRLARRNRASKWRQTLQTCG